MKRSLTILFSLLIKIWKRKKKKDVDLASSDNMSMKRNAEPLPGQSKKAKHDNGADELGKYSNHELCENGSFSYAKQNCAILKLSDEILLCVLWHLGPRDIISLGSTCQRLDAVIRDRTLWGEVNLSDQPMMLCQLQEFMRYLHSTTKSIVTKGCVKLVDAPARWEQQCAPIKMFRQLMKACPDLEIFEAIEHYYDARHVYITDFPASLRKLSLQGCEVYFLPAEKSYFHGINKHMVNLKELILDECQWLTPDALMALCKCSNLKKLSMRSCRNVFTCYAYVSLSTRFGFKSLEVLDVRGTYLGDHEISCFQFIESLKHLYLEVPESRPQSVTKHKNKARLPHCPHNAKMRGPLSTIPCCLCYADRSPEEDRERQLLTKKEVPTFQITSHSVRSTVEYNYEMKIIDDESGLNVPFIVADLGEQIDPDTLITDDGILSLGKSEIYFDSTNHEYGPPVQRNPNLHELMILNCRGVTDMSLFHLLIVPSLRYLTIRGTSITPEGLESFRQQRPEVKVVSDI